MRAAALVAPLSRCGESDEPERRRIVRVERQDAPINCHGRLRRRLRSDLTGQRAGVGVKGPEVVG